MRTLAVGSLSLMALAAANEAVPPPMRTYGTFSEAVVRDGAIQRQKMRCVQKTTHRETDRGGRWEGKALVLASLLQSQMMTESAAAQLQLQREYLYQ